MEIKRHVVDGGSTSASADGKGGKSVENAHRGRERKGEGEKSREPSKRASERLLILISNNE